MERREKTKAVFRLQASSYLEQFERTHEYILPFYNIERGEKGTGVAKYSADVMLNPHAYYSLATLRASRVFSHHSPTIRTPGKGYGVSN